MLLFPHVMYVNAYILRYFFYYFRASRIFWWWWAMSPPGGRVLGGSGQRHGARAQRSRSQGVGQDAEGMIIPILVIWSSVYRDLSCYYHVIIYLVLWCYFCHSIWSVLLTVGIFVLFVSQSVLFEYSINFEIIIYNKKITKNNKKWPINKIPPNHDNVGFIRQAATIPADCPARCCCRRDPKAAPCVVPWGWTDRPCWSGCSTARGWARSMIQSYATPSFFVIKINIALFFLYLSS